MVQGAAHLPLLPQPTPRNALLATASLLAGAAALGYSPLASASSMLLVGKTSLTDWLAKVRRMREGIATHSAPLDAEYLFNNQNSADRITLLGVAVNIVLALSKFAGGLAFHSAVLVADAGHSLSDLLSDAITLWAVRVARLPPDQDHPQGHRKFESVGSLVLSLVLLGTGLGVGGWSYSRLLHAEASTSLPSLPALALALVSIAVKEWLFRVTKRVGEAEGSQLLIANAWHHRSDSFSSVLSLLSIGLAIAMPRLRAVDALGGMLVAGVICLTGVDVLGEAVKQLTDASDQHQHLQIQGAETKEMEVRAALRFVSLTMQVLVRRVDVTPSGVEVLLWCAPSLSRQEVLKEAQRVGKALKRMPGIGQLLIMEELTSHMDDHDDNGYEDG